MKADRFKGALDTMKKGHSRLRFRIPSKVAFLRFPVLASYQNNSGICGFSESGGDYTTHDFRPAIESWKRR